MGEFTSPDPGVLETWGEDVKFTPAAGAGTSYDVRMTVSSNAPDPDVQPAPILVLFGTLDDSGFTAAGAPLPVKGDAFHFDGREYECYLVQQDRSGGMPGTNGTWCYLTQEGG